MRLTISTILLLALTMPVLAQDKAQVKCGPADAQRIMFKEAEAINVLGYIPCGAEVEILDSAKSAYRVRYGGQSGYILPDAVDGKSVSAPVAGAAQSSESGNAQQPQADTKPLTNADITGMLDAGLSPEIVIAKINISKGNFDTSPETLKALKTKGVPDNVVLAMVQAPAKRDENTKSADSTSIAAPAPASDSAAAKQADAGRQAEQKKRQAMQQVDDWLEDCRTRAQNEYTAKMNAMGTMALSPMMRVYAANKLKQNMDEEMRYCRAQYESSQKAIEAK